VDGASADEYMWTAFYNAIVSDSHLFLLLFLTLTIFNEVSSLSTSIYFSSNVNSSSNPFLEPTSTKQ